MEEFKHVTQNYIIHFCVPDTAILINFLPFLMIYSFTYVSSSLNYYYYFSLLGMLMYIEMHKS